MLMILRSRTEHLQNFVVSSSQNRAPVWRGAALKSHRRFIQNCTPVRSILKILSIFHCIRMKIHVYTYIHTYIHTYTHTYPPNLNSRGLFIGFVDVRTVLDEVRGRSTRSGLRAELSPMVFCAPVGERIDSQKRPHPRSCVGSAEHVEAGRVSACLAQSWICSLT